MRLALSGLLFLGADRNSVRGCTKVPYILQMRLQTLAQRIVQLRQNRASERAPPRSALRASPLVTIKGERAGEAVACKVTAEGIVGQLSGDSLVLLRLQQGRLSAG